MNRTAITVRLGKLLVAAGLVYWLLQSGYLDLRLLTSTLDNPLWIGAALGVVGLNTIVAALRWHLLLRAQEVRLPFRDSLRVSLIGLFFSMFVPGGISGDVMKVYYVAGRVKHAKTATLLSIFADRVLGLTSLMALSLMAVALRWHDFAANSQVRMMAYGVAGFFACFVLAVPILLSSTLRNHRLVISVLARLPFSRVLNNAVDALQAFRRSWRDVALSVAASFVVAVLSVLSFWCFGHALGQQELAFADYSVVVPFVFISMIIPIAPAGVGVGQAASVFLFALLGNVGKGFGANIITLYQVALLLFSLFGATVYLAYHRDIPAAPAAEIETV